MVRDCNKPCTLYGVFIVTPSLEGWSAKTKESPSPHQAGLAPPDINPAFQYTQYISTKDKPSISVQKNSKDTFESQFT